MRRCGPARAAAAWLVALSLAGAGLGACRRPSARATGGTARPPSSLKATRASHRRAVASSPAPSPQVPGRLLGGRSVLTAKGCPDPATCPDFVVIGVGWQPRPGGKVVIPYRIDPVVPPPSRLAPWQVVAAVRAAARTWMGADPRLDLRYLGTTRLAPAENDVIGFGAAPARAITDIAHGPGGYFDGYYTAFDITFLAGLPWSWVPCRAPRGRRCSAYRTWARGRAGPDLQDTATHEWGHVLGLEHVNQPWDYQLVMWGGGDAPTCPGRRGCRWRDRLGLGDVLGVRWLYPTPAPLPALPGP